jgi:hypothetical protein
MASALREPGVRPMDFTGRPLRGFVYAAPLAIAAEAELGVWVDKGLAFTEREDGRMKAALDVADERQSPARGRRVPVAALTRSGDDDMSRAN